MNNYEFSETARMIANCKTLYCSGGIGEPLNDWGKSFLINLYQYNRDRAALINSKDADWFAFDCIGLVKSILWGFSFNHSSNYGGAIYQSNGVPDRDEQWYIENCLTVSSDFSNIPIGAYLWMRGHCGIYLGNGLAAECTPIWNDGVQITCVSNLGTKQGYNNRYWELWGKLPYVDYLDPYEWHKGDLVVLTQGSKVYGTENYFASWVYNTRLEVMEEPYEDRVVLSHNGVLVGACYGKDLIPYEPNEDENRPNEDGNNSESINNTTDENETENEPKKTLTDVLIEILVAICDAIKNFFSPNKENKE